jgi:thymidylate synthase ThyX
MPTDETQPLPDGASTRKSGTEVYAVHGADPEVLAYAMAKYSRSALTLKESLREISAQRAEQFLNTFYFQYGHRSIADLAHLAFAVERLSLRAAMVLVDEQRWDGQERSTRYQDFEKSGWYTPVFPQSADRETYTSAVGNLLGRYREVSDGVFAEMKAATERPPEMKPEAFDRTLRARAFDVARYLLPLAANTSLGQIVNARTLETQVSRLLSHPLAEIRALGEALREAAAGDAWQPQAEPGARAVRVAPTLVKYAVPNRYLIETRKLMAECAASVMAGAAVAPAPVVDLIEESDSLEIDLTASLLYSASQYPYRQLRDHVAALSENRREEIIDLGLRERGRHDELLREFGVGQRLRFDILMDIGGFRDMHRHRRCTQLLQGFTGEHGWETPEGLGAQEGVFTAAMQSAATARAALTEPEGVPYLLPLATRTRALFRMDFAEALYISELRSAPQGHFSYRRVAWQMYQAVARKHPGLARHFRVTDGNAPVDLLKR